MKTVLITGATSGIGEACARAFAKNNFQLILCGRRAEKLRTLHQELSAQTAVHTLCFDVSDRAAVQAALDADFLKEHTVDILINNAGNAHGLDLLDEADVDDWDAMMDINVKGLLYVSQPIIKQMKQRGSGHIINISSVAARQTYARGVVYCASKKAVDILSEGMRLELTEFGIKVTNIQPGAVATNFSEVRFKGDAARAAAVYEGYEALTAEDIAAVVTYVASAPAHVCISDLTVYPAAQAEPRTIHRKQ